MNSNWSDDETIFTGASAAEPFADFDATRAEVEGDRAGAAQPRRRMADLAGMKRIVTAIAAVGLAATVAACGSNGAAPAAAPASSSATASSTPSVESKFRKAAETCGLTGSLAADGKTLATGVERSTTLGCFIDEAGGMEGDAFTRALTVEGEQGANWAGVNMRWMRVGDQAQFVAADTTVSAGLPELKTSLTDPAFHQTATATSAPDESTEPTATPAAEPEVPAEFEAALAKADSYANTMNMSKASLHEQLTSSYGEGFPKAAADYAVKHVVADWKANALAKAKSYRDDMNMSNSAIRNQLTSKYGERFTKAEAAYAMANMGK